MALPNLDGVVVAWGASAWYDSDSRQVVGHKLFPGLLKNRYPKHFQTQYDIRQKWRDNPADAEGGDEAGERRSRSPSSRARRALDCFAPSLPEAPKRGGFGWVAVFVLFAVVSEVVLDATTHGGTGTSSSSSWLTGRRLLSLSWPSSWDCSAMVLGNTSSRSSAPWLL